MFPATFCLLILNEFLAGPVQDPTVPSAMDRAVYEKVVVISVDGLRSDALIVGGIDLLPNFHDLIRSCSTLNARTDQDFTVTMPNHAGMLTSRPTLGPWGHQWSENEIPQPWETMHDRVSARYLPGMFDVAHDHGVATALLASKEKFILFDRTWNDENGEPDATGRDNGRDKIDLYVFESGNTALTNQALEFLGESAGPCLIFLHFSLPDLAGHAYGWDVAPTSTYMRTVTLMDELVGRVLVALQTVPSLAGRSALILTADHGGGAPFNNHGESTVAINYRIPFLVWLGRGTPPSDLYNLNAGTRENPGPAQVAAGNPGQPPIRNRDAANLALALMGLLPVPGSPVSREPILNVLGPLR